MQPGVLPPVPYRGVRPAESGGARALGTMSPHPQGWGADREAGSRRPAAGGAGARADGRTNGSAPLLHAGTDDKPKRLPGLHQKVRGWCRGSRACLPQTLQPPAERRGLTQRGTPAERGKPGVSPPGKAHRKGSRRGGGERRREEAKAARYRGGEGLSRQATGARAQARRLPSGLSSRERLAHRRRGEST